jgi:hypothetical protein
MKRFVLSFLVLLTFSVGCASSPGAPNATLTAGTAGSFQETPDTLIVAVPIRNETDAPANDVRVTSVTLEGVRVATALPVALGTIPGKRSADLNVTFAGALEPGRTYDLVVSGTYGGYSGGSPFTVRHPVRIPPKSPGSADAKRAGLQPKFADGKRYPKQPPRFPPAVNSIPRWSVPTGTFRAPMPRPAGTGVEKAPQPRPDIAMTSQAGVVTFSTNEPVGISASTINEPSGAAGGGVVLVTFNWTAAYSTDGGATFTEIDPTTIFPNEAGFCCDQIVQYVPSIDRFIWLMQMSDRQRIAAASPAAIISSGGTAWTYWDITEAILGFGGLDFPDLSIGNNSLYVSTDGGPGLIVMRLPLNEIRDSLTVNFWFTNPADSPMAWFGHLTQNASDEIFWAGHNSNTSMRVFSWQESSTTYFWRDVAVGSWPNNKVNLDSRTPDGLNWMSKLADHGVFFIAGATRVINEQRNEIWLAWTAASGQNFRQPHVQIVVLDRNRDFALISQLAIWNDSYAFGYPAFTSSALGETAMSLEWGGGGNYENHVVGFWGDFVVYATTSSNKGVPRFGDYVTIRPSVTGPKRFDAFGYGVVDDGSGTRTDTRYVVFGRP